MTASPLFFIVVAAVLLVAGILAFGIGGFARGMDGKKANKVMQWRIIAQFVAVGLILLLAFVGRG